MRLTLPAKLVLFALGLAGLYTLWRRSPEGRALWHPVDVRALKSLRPSRPRPAGPAHPGASGGVTKEAPPHTGLLIGYVGAPPPAAIDLSRPGAATGPPPNPLLRRETGQAATLAERESAPDLLEDVGSGALDAGAVDYPSVVFAARRGRTPYHVVLLVGWRKGADALAVRGGGPWRPGRPVDFVPGTSGEYLLWRALLSGRFSPAEVAAGRERMKRPEHAAPEAAIGRRDRMTRAERSWPVWARAEDFGAPMPDVLVVNTRFARRHPETVTEIVRAWLAGQDETRAHPDRYRRYVKEEAVALHLPVADVEESLKPATYGEQRAFVGLDEKGTNYAEVALRQVRTLEPGPRPPADFTVPVDRGPLAEAAPMLVE